MGNVQFEVSLRHFHEVGYTTDPQTQTTGQAAATTVSTTVSTTVEISSLVTHYSSSKRPLLVSRRKPGNT
jgi:hypothetical protein